MLFDSTITFSPCSRIFRTVPAALRQFARRRPQPERPLRPRRQVPPGIRLAGLVLLRERERVLALPGAQLAVLALGWRRRRGRTA